MRDAPYVIIKGGVHHKVRHHSNASHGRVETICGIVFRRRGGKPRFSTESTVTCLECIATPESL